MTQLNTQSMFAALVANGMDRDQANKVVADAEKRDKMTHVASTDDHTAVFKFLRALADPETTRDDLEEMARQDARSIARFAYEYWADNPFARDRAKQDLDYRLGNADLVASAPAKAPKQKRTRKVTTDPDIIQRRSDALAKARAARTAKLKAAAELAAQQETMAV